MTPIDPKDLLRGLIAWMRHAGAAPTRTRLVKFLYLADLQRARYAHGETITGWRWYVDSFGPFTPEAPQLFDRGVREGWLRCWSAADDSASNDELGAIGYDLVDAQGAADLLPPELGKVRQWIKLYGGSTSGLLRFVYGNTEPMESARSGDVLDFSLARPAGGGPAIAATPLTRKQEKKLEGLMARLRTDYATARGRSAALLDGPEDAVFADGVPRDEPLPAAELLIHFPEPPRNN